MTVAFLVGSLAGLGLFLLGLALHPPRPRLARRLAAFDAARRGANGHWTGGHDAPATDPRWRLGSWLARLCAEQGWEFSGLQKNLSLAGIPFEIFLATNPGTQIEVAGYPWGTFTSAPGQLNAVVGQIVPSGALVRGLPEA